MTSGQFGAVGFSSLDYNVVNCRIMVEGDVAEPTAGERLLHVKDFTKRTGKKKNKTANL